MTTAPETTWPRIFLSVQREIEGRPAVALREISLDEFLRGRYMGPLLVNEINAMLREVGWRPD